MSDQRQGKGCGIPQPDGTRCGGWFDTVTYPKVVPMDH